MSYLWQVDIVDTEFPGQLNLRWTSGCKFSSGCTQFCDQCSSGTSQDWYVRDLRGILPMPNGVIQQVTSCEWSNCCFEVFSG
jgi:hypothetical protein